MTECITQEEAETIHEINRIYPPPRNVPLLDEWNDHVSFQRLREDDIRRRGRSRIEDQRVRFKGHEAVGHQHPHFMAVAGGAPDPGDLDDDDDDDDNGNGGSNNPCPDHGENHRHHSSNNNSRNGGNGGRPPPSNGGGSGNPPGNNHRESCGYSMPPPAAHRYSTPGVHEAAENHRDTMHERLYALMRQHLTVRLTIPQGSKTRKPESDSVGKVPWWTQVQRTGGLVNQSHRNVRSQTIRWKRQGQGTGTPRTPVSGWGSEEVVSPTCGERQTITIGVDVRRGDNRTIRSIYTPIDNARCMKRILRDTIYRRNGYTRVLQHPNGSRPEHGHVSRYVPNSGNVLTENTIVHTHMYVSGWAITRSQHHRRLHIRGKKT
jgi:hypothetical protein